MVNLETEGKKRESSFESQLLGNSNMSRRK